MTLESSQPFEFMEKDFAEICEHLDRLHRLASLAYGFHTDGLKQDELKELLQLLVEAIEHNTRRTDLHILATLSWLQERITWLPRKRFLTLKKLKEMLPTVPALPRVYEGRRFIRQLKGLPPPPTLQEIIDDLDALIEGFTNELIRHTRLLRFFFKAVNPESIPWIVKFVERNPGHVRTSLGEPLCIWWLSEVLSDFKPLWRHTRGPLKVRDVEVDALSVRNERLAVAEIKIAKPGSVEYEKACIQVVRAIERFVKPDMLQLAGFKWIKRPCIPSEAAVITLYNLNDYKEELKSILAWHLSNIGINKEIASVYDINDLLNIISKWRSKSKERYKELFITLNRILEAI